MQLLLATMNQVVTDSGGYLDQQTLQPYLDQYHKVLNHADNECPEPKPDPDKKQRGRIKRSKARN